MHPPKPKPCYIVWNEPLQTSASMSMYTRRNIWFNQTGDISTLNGRSLKLVDKFIYLGSSVSSTETDVNTQNKLIYNLFLLKSVGHWLNTGDPGSIPGRVIPKYQKWYLMPACLALSIIRWGSRVKWSNPGNGVASSSTPPCSSYWKRSLRVTLD